MNVARTPVRSGPRRPSARRSGQPRDGGRVQRLRAALAIPRYGAPTRYRPPPTGYARLQWVGHRLTRLGLTPDYVVTLEVPGRRSGVLRRTSLILLPYHDGRHLVALAGESEWVRNVRAADGRAVLARAGRREAVVLEEVRGDDRVDVLHAYLWRDGRRSGDRRVAREADVYFGLDGEPDRDALRELAGRYPVFRVREDGDRHRSGATAPGARH